jgi:hypothetical protein
MAINKYTAAYNVNNYLYTKGREYTLNGKSYIGEYHLDGDVPMTGPVPAPESKQLRRMYNNLDHYIYDGVFLFSVPVLNYVDPVPFIYKPLSQAYITGFDARFFVEKKDDEGYAIEIDSMQYDKIGSLGGIDGGLYQHTIVEWKLTGRRDDIIKYNEYQIKKASKIVPTVQYAIRNYLEFAQITLV